MMKEWNRKEKNPENVIHMTGWKTKTGSFLVAIAGVIAGSTTVIPIPEVIPWIKFVSFIFGGFGTALVAWGTGHKLEKNRTVFVESKKPLEMPSECAITK